MKPNLGILGGMGAQAGVDFAHKLVMLTGAASDQDHIPFLLHSASHIPSRLDFLSSKPGATDPFDAMLSATKVLESAGVEYIVIACNTAHYWASRLQKNLQPRILSMIEAVAESLEEQHIQSVWIMSTTATLKHRIYEDVLSKHNIKLNHLSKSYQEKLLDSIYMIKSSRIEEGSLAMTEVFSHLVNDVGASKIIMGCTEVPIGLSHLAGDPHLVDATEILARKCIHLLK